MRRTLSISRLEGEFLSTIPSLARSELSSNASLSNALNDDAIARRRLQTSAIPDTLERDLRFRYGFPVRTHSVLADPQDCCRAIHFAHSFVDAPDLLRRHPLPLALRRFENLGQRVAKEVLLRYPARTTRGEGSRTATAWSQLSDITRPLGAAEHPHRLCRHLRYPLQVHRSAVPFQAVLDQHGDVLDALTETR